MCPLSPESPGGTIPFLEQLRATGMATHELKRCYRADKALIQLLEPLRDGKFTEVELGQMVASGALVECDIGEEVEFSRFGTRKTYQCVNSAVRATVLFYNNEDAKAFTKRMQAGKQTFQVACVDVMDLHADPSAEARCHLGDLEDFLEGAPECVVFDAGCPVRVGRSCMGEALSTPGGGVLTQHSTGEGNKKQSEFELHPLFPAPTRRARASSLTLDLPGGVFVPTGSRGVFERVVVDKKDPRLTVVVCLFDTAQGKVMVRVPMVEHYRSTSAPAGMKVLSRFQVPLTVAYAMTVSSAQGCEFDELIVDFRGHNDGTWLPHALYTAASRGKRYDRTKFINIPALGTNILCAKMILVEKMMEEEMKFRTMQEKSRQATMDHACMIENMLIRAQTNLQQAAEEAHAKRKTKTQ